MKLDINTILKEIQNLRNMFHAVDREEEAGDRAYGRSFSTDVDFIRHWHTEEATRKRNTLSVAISALVDQLPELSTDMVQTMNALQTLGMVYLAKDENGKTYAYAKYPERIPEALFGGGAMWVSRGKVENIPVVIQVPAVLDTLCSWNDEKPVHMRELMQAKLGIASPSLSILQGLSLNMMGDFHPCAEQPIGKKMSSYSSFHHFGDLTDNH